MHKRRGTALLGLLVASLLVGGCAAAPTARSVPTVSQDFVFGVIMVGPYVDQGWSEAHFAAGRYVEANLPNSRMLYLDSLNPHDRPETTLEEAVDDMVAQGARLIFVTSDDFAADTYLVAQQHPDVVFVHISGDHVLRGDAPPNLGNYMARMEYGKMIAGCAAALTTQTGVLGYLGPLINDETRRLANSTYLGARYCWQKLRQRTPDGLHFRVEWIGYWFYIPGVTRNPTEVANQLLDGGADVIVSGIDTTEALLVAGERAAAGEAVSAVPYDYEGACSASPEACLGVAFFNWGPAYLRLAREVLQGSWQPRWEWVGPNWEDINDRDTSALGFVKGDALSGTASAQLERFIGGLAEGSIELFRGPLDFQDGSPYLAAGEVATDDQIWYMPQLLAGMEGLSD
jgi:simple sugar transport system substrate-binding protein